MLSDNGDGAMEDIASEARPASGKALMQWVEAGRAAIVPKTMPTPESQDAKLAPIHQDSIRRGSSYSGIGTQAASVAMKTTVGRRNISTMPGVGACASRT